MTAGTMKSCPHDREIKIHTHRRVKPDANGIIDEQMGEVYFMDRIFTCGDCGALLAHQAVNFVEGTAKLTAGSGPWLERWRREFESFPVDDRIVRSVEIKGVLEI